MTSVEPDRIVPLHAFVLLARARPGVDYAANIENSGLEGVRYRPILGHHAFMVVRPGRSLVEAAQLAEYDIQSSFSGACWVLLCPTCDLPLSVAPIGYACSVHGAVFSHNLVDEVVETPTPQRRRPSRHRTRSAHKREAMGAAWARFLQESSSSVVTLPHLIEAGQIPDARPGDDSTELGPLRSELGEMLDAATAKRTAVPS